CVAPNGFEPAICDSTDPDRNCTELSPLVPVPVPNTLPLNPLPSVSTDPLWNVRELTSSANRLWPAVVSVTAPEMEPVAPPATAIRVLLVLFRRSVEPAATWKSAPGPPDTVITADPWSATFVLPEMSSWPMVWRGTYVAVVVAPLLNSRTFEVDRADL